MASESDQPSTDPVRRPLATTDLPTLLAALRQLYLQVSWRLVHHRLARPGRRGGAAVKPGIADPLMDHIARAVTEESAGPDAVVPIAGAGSPVQTGPAATTLPMPTEGFFGRLAAYFRRRPSHAPDPHLAEQMRHSTNEHINRAVILTRQGQKEAARMHAQLAESAMRTAAEYMAAEDYEVFRQDVERRLHAIDGP